MNHFRSSFLAELEKVAERKRSSKKKRAAGIGTGAVTGGAMGAPAGLLGALALLATRPKKFRILMPKGIRAKHNFLYRGGLIKEIDRVSREGRKQALIGTAAGAGGGAAMGALAGHEISKHAAVIASRITPGSSSVRGYSYDKNSGNLLITFKNGGTYRYKGVPPAAAKAMGRNKSVGKTVHKRIKSGGYEYEKVGKQKSYTCRFCKEQATKGILWAEGRGIIPCCDKHLEKGKTQVRHPDGTRDLDGIDGIRDLTKTAEFSPVSDAGMAIGRSLEKHEEPISLALGTALGTSAGLPLGAALGGRSFAKRVGEQVKHPNPKAGPFRKVVHAIQSLPKGSSLRSSLVRELAKGGAIGGLVGVAGGGLFGYQVSKGHRRNKQMRSDIDGLRREIDLIKKSAEEPLATMPVEPLEPPETETPISGRVFENLTLRAKNIPEEAVASQSEMVMDKMSSRRRQIAKLAGACKKQMTWHGLTMKFEYLDGEERSGVSKDGKKWSRTMRGCYGYMPGTYGKGADGEAIDIYFSPKAPDDEPGSVYKIRQMRKDDGKFDEDKFMVGYASAADAKKAFLSNMPSWAFGDITEMSMDSFKTLVGQDGKS